VTATVDAPQRLANPLFVRVVLATFAYFVAVGALLPTIPLYVRGPLGRGDAGVGIAVAAFAVSAVVLRPFAGRAGDRRGRRLIMVGGAGALAASIAAYTLADSLPVLVLLRAVTGAGEGFFFVGAVAVVSDLAPDARRGEAMSYFSLGLHGGLALGPAFGETVLRLAGFDAVWLVSGACAALGAVLCMTVQETRPPAAALAQRARLINPSGVLPGTILFFMMLGIVAFTAFLPLYARELGLRGSAVAFLLYSGIVLVIRSVGAKLPDILGYRRAAALALTGGMVGLLVVAGVGNVVGLFVGTALCAIGHGLAFPALISMAVTSSPEAERGSAVGTVSMFFDAGFGFGAAVSGLLASWLGYRGAFAAAAGGVFIGLLLIAGSKRGFAAASPPAGTPHGAPAGAEGAGAPAGAEVSPSPPG